jgi:hypothetical protein
MADPVVLETETDTELGDASRPMYGAAAPSGTPGGYARYARYAGHGRDLSMAARNKSPTLGTRP